MFSIYKLTLKEMLRKKVLLVTSILVIIYLLCYALGLHFTTPSGNSNMQLGNDTLQKSIYSQLLGFAIYTGGFISAFLAVFSASGSIASEVESGLMHSIATKPIRRWKILAGKGFGYATGCVIFNCILLTAILIVSDKVTGQHVLSANIPTVYGLFCLQPLPLLSATLLASVFLPAISAGVVGASAFILSITGGMMGQMGKIAFQNPVLMKIGIVTGFLTPMDAIYRRIYTILVPPTFLGSMGPFGAALKPVPWIGIYALTYVVIMAIIAGSFFERKDL